MDVCATCLLYSGLFSGHVSIMGTRILLSNQKAKHFLELGKAAIALIGGPGATVRVEIALDCQCVCFGTHHKTLHISPAKWPQEFVCCMEKCE